MTTFIQPAAPKWGGNQHIQRDRYGRPLVVPPNGTTPVPYTRATTYIDAVSDKSNLMDWWARMTALGLAQRDDLLLQVATTEKDDTQALKRLVDQAAEAAGARSSATIGTELHEATERHDLGQPPTLLGKYQADLDAYIAATKGLDYHAVEQFRVHDDLQIGGTADRMVHLDDTLVVADVKTGKLWDVGSMAMQLAVYARSTPYDPETNTRGTDPYPVDLNRGLLIHLPAGEGTCTLYWLNLQAGWEAVQIAKRVREWRQFHSRKATRGEVIIDVSDDDARRFAGN